MKIKFRFLIFFLTLAGMAVSLSPLGAVHSGMRPQQTRSMYKEENRVQQTNLDKKNERKKQRKKEKTDGLSLAAHIAISVGIASFFLLPVLGLVLLPAGFIMGVIAWVGGKKRNEQKRGRGLALAAMVVGGVFTAGLLAAFMAFVLAY